MVKCSSGTHPTDILFHLCKLPQQSLLMVFPQFNGVDSLRISSLEILVIISLQLLVLKNLHFGLLIHQLEVVNMKLLVQVLWLETTHVWHSQSQMKNFCLLDQNQVISALSK